MKKTWLGLFALLAACNSQPKLADTNPAATTATAASAAAPATQNEYLCIPLKQFGKVLPTHTPADLERIFGKENITTEPFYVEGDFVREQTAVFLGKPNEFFITWQEERAPFTKIMSISVSAKGSPYVLESGIKIGSTSAELATKLNGGQPFMFSGFGWDFGGACCMKSEGVSLFTNLAFRLDLPEKAFETLSEQQKSQVLGDQLISSSLEVFKDPRHTPYVAEMTVVLSEYK